ncbi:GNAT family N-acetyltransferase [Piscinibacter sakaiensis]|uniref:N-acetyltransferase domain-containing protein n=1 Tax=Piscinibacter sakaiensis TaxID=1547922 RepID=A0A0K8NYQ7_PISS1|nr:GNAT family N-acetyltransferase [Piscinibacter sakaiensis]GAP35434.1 hypothetical protein ISF6_1207 [Piscinibacter sakaiensis]
MPALTLHPAPEVAPPALHAAFVAAFADYLAGPFELPLAAWPGFLARQGIALAQSRVVRGADGAVLAFAFVAPRPAARRWRLATMGAVPAARGRGAAPALLDDLLQRARAAGLEGVELEVFERNERARRLYAGRGFEARHRLDGWRHEPAPDAAGPARPAAAEPVDLDTAAAWLARADAACPELPLQVLAPAVAGLEAPFVALQRGRAQLLASAPATGPLRIASLVDLDPRQADAQALVEALLAQHPGRAVVVPQLQREDVGGAALHRAGFAALPLHQQWMRWRP